MFSDLIVILWIPAARRLACSALGFLWSIAMWPDWPQYQHSPSLFRRSFSFAVSSPWLAVDTSIGPVCVPVAIEGSKVVVAVTVVRGALKTNLLVGWRYGGLATVLIIAFAQFAFELTLF